MFGARATRALGSVRPLSSGAKIGVASSARIGKAHQMAGRSIKGIHSAPKPMTHAVQKFGARAGTKFKGRVAA